MLKNLRWIILQDAAVLIGVHNRKHSLFDFMPEIFNSKEFKSFTSLMINHLNHSKYDEANEIVIERVLPGINSKISNQTKAIVSLEKTIIDKASSNVSTMENSIRSLGQYISEFPGFQNIEAKKISNALSSYNNINDTKVVNNNLITEQNIELRILIPIGFPNFGQMLLFWNTNEQKFLDKKYYKLYNKNEKQRVYRIKQIIKTFHEQSVKNNVDITISKFEKFYKDNNKSVYKLLEKFCKPLDKEGNETFENV